MWKDSKCIIVNFILNFSNQVIGPYEPLSPEMNYSIRSTEVPNSISSTSPEELAAELIKFIMAKAPDEKNLSNYFDRFKREFWEMEGVNIDDVNLPLEMQLKIDNVYELTRIKLDEVKYLRFLEKVPELNSATGEELATELANFITRIASEDEQTWDIYFDRFKKEFWEMKGVNLNDVNLPLKMQLKIDNVYELTRKKLDEAKYLRFLEKVPKFNSATVEELATELATFIMEKSQKNEQFYDDNQYIEFWKKYKIDLNNRYLPSLIFEKINATNKLSHSIYENEMKLKYEKRQELEMQELPSLVQRLVIYVKKDLGKTKPPTKVQIRMFLNENNIDILPQTQEKLFLRAMKEFL